MRRLVLAVALASIACGAPPASEGDSVIASTLAASETTATEATATTTIGTATLAPDGTIVLHLRAELPGGGLGDGELRYPPDHPDHAAVLAHLGGLRPGETKEVAPWP